MTNYLTEPAISRNVLEDVLADFWVSCQPSPVMDKLGWDTLKKLRQVPYGVYLAFEQGRNCPPMVLAWRDEPDKDLANYDDVGYELHAVGQPGHRAEPAPELVALFHDPIDAFIVEMAKRIDERAASHQERPGALLVQSGQLTNVTQILINAAVYEVAGRIIERIEQHMLLRAGVYDDDGRLLGLGPDLAPGLSGAWQHWRARNR
jgi:hypothetical protein